MIHPLRFGFVTLVALMALMTNCSCQKKLVIDQVLLDRLPGADEFPMTREALKVVIADELNKDASLRFKPGQGSSVLRVRMYLDNSKTLVVSVKYSGKNGNEEELHFGRGAVLLTPNVTPDKAFARALRLGLVDMISSWRGDEQSPEALLSSLERYLTGEDVSENTLLQSIYLLGLKKEKRAVRPLCSVLILNNPRAAMAALTSLTEIGDPQAVEAIIRFAERKPSPIRLQVIAVVRQLGGPKAAAWLFTISTGHEDPEVRDAASAALTDVEKRLLKSS